MDHRAYPKIAARSGERPLSGGTWVATEKIHGANLVVATDGVRDAVGKRKRWLAHDEPFFGWQLLRSDLVAAARVIRDALRCEGTVRLYAELFGGEYPHPDVASVPGASAVQTGIWYSPDVRVALFDIAVERPGNDLELLAHSEVERLGATCELLVVPVLARGPRSELDALPVRYPSKVSGLLGLPPIAGNMAEGFVLKPDAPARFAERAILKRKIPEFDDARFDESAPFDATARLDLAALLEIASRLVNPARIASARSKVGIEPNAIREEVVLDVLVDLESAFPATSRALDDVEEEKLRHHIGELAQVHL